MLLDQSRMGLYHPRPAKILTLLVGMIFLCVGCVSPQATPTQITVSLIADGQTKAIQLPQGSSVQRVLDVASLQLNTLDRTEPPLFTIVGHGDVIHVIRVSEEFEVTQEEIPFKIQTLLNESLSEDKEILIQSGKNGLREITYRKVFEDGVEESNQPVPVKITVLQEPVPEIRMIGIQAPFSPIKISGRLIYLRDGNVWMMEGTTSNRRAILTMGDLDSRVFSLSQNGSWMLFTRKGMEENQINTLWAAEIKNGLSTISEDEMDTEEQTLFDLQVSNIIHFADWLPNSDTQIAYSDVEPRDAPPGWQANNNMISFTFSTSGWTSKPTIVLEENSGGVYGWWGTDFAWGPDGKYLAYTRPDSVGILDFRTGEMTTTLELTPLFTRSDWAWVPSATWSPDGKFLYSVDHQPQPGLTSPEESQIFDLSAISLESGSAFDMVPQVGMFSYPITSPLQPSDNSGMFYQIAYLQAIYPNQSENSRYRLALVNHDGSEQRVLFPAIDKQGIEPQMHWGAWSPAPLPDSGNFAIAVIYQGNLWIVDVVSGDAIQITGDGLTTRIIWSEIQNSQVEP